MNKERINYLYQAYLNDTATSGELQELESSMADPQAETFLDEALYNSYFNAPQVSLTSEAAEKKEEIFNKIVNQRRTQRPLWQKITAAAAAVMAITLGVWMYNMNKLASPAGHGAEYANDINPGKQGATLTLANGQVIQLSDQKTGVVVGNELRYSDGSVVRDSSRVHSLATEQGADGKVQNLIARTSRGQTYQFTLPDGTKVWLNAESSISFPNQFIGKERKIVLIGEAYFAVVHNAKQPFKVESKGQVVEDIGTEFNINAYSDESNTKTTLVEGSAKVNEVLLKPNQQAVLSTSRGDGAARGGSIKVQTIDAEDATAWKNGLFIFEDEPLQSIMKKVSRWYDVEVVYQQGVDKGQLYGGSVSRYDKVSSVLEGLELTKGIHFKIEGRRITVMQ
jgi:transmembrane sensor